MIDIRLIEKHVKQNVKARVTFTFVRQGRPGILVIQVTDRNFYHVTQINSDLEYYLTFFTSVIIKKILMVYTLKELRIMSISILLIISFIYIYMNREYQYD